MEITSATEISAVSQFEQWMAAHHDAERVVWAAILKKSSGRQTVTFDELLNVALCWGWVDVKTKRIDEEWYGIRFVPRRPKSNWSPTNRHLVCRLIGEGRMQPAGLAVMPADLICLR